MNEQSNQQDDNLQGDDVEAHKTRYMAQEDTEGHKAGLLPDDEDTEGHRAGLLPGDDVEGHKAAPIEGDEDVEGHRYVQPPRDTDLGGTDR